MSRRSRRKYFAGIEWGDFEGDRIILPVCPRSQAVNSRNFEATVMALAERVNHVHVLLCDTLDRYNLEGTPKAKEVRAHIHGSRWLDLHLPVIEEHIGSFDVRRWDRVRGDPGFDPRLQLMHRLYAQNADMRRIVDNVASHYLVAKEKRFTNKGLPFNYEIEKQNSVCYLLEEFAGDAVCNEWFGGLPEAYWGFYVGDPDIFNRVNTLNRAIDLTIPPTCAVHLNRLSPPLRVEHTPRVA